MKNLKNLPQKIDGFIKTQCVIGGKITVLETRDHHSFEAVCNFIIENQLVNYLVICAPTLGRCILAPPIRNCSFFSFYEECESFAKLLGNHDCSMPTVSSIWQTNFLLAKSLDDFFELISDELENGKLVIL